MESGWRQFTAGGNPLVSYDFGYGIMQITSGMAGASGSVDGSIDGDTQSRVASDYVYNIAYGARILEKKWESLPPVGDGDPAIIENWYYALWAYNGWGWVNNPNNPRFTRTGTPASNPSAFPYQERILYLVAHPPRDALGNPLWEPVPVTLPSRHRIGRHPGPLSLQTTHRQDVPALSGIYKPVGLAAFTSGATHTVAVQVINTGTQPWLPSGAFGVSLEYHLLTSSANVWRPFSPFSPGVLAFGQGATPLSRGILPGQGIRLHVRVTAPARPGVYQLAWDLTRGSSLFSQLGVPVHVQELRVLSQTLKGSPIRRPSPIPTVLPPLDERYVADTSVPDGSVLHVHQRFLKGWLVFNDGKLAWPAGSSLRLVSGPSFGARSAPLPTVDACHSVTIVVPMRAPGHVGSYTSVWQVRDAAGHAFGEPLTVTVNVRRTSSIGTPPPPPSISPTPGPVQITVTPTPTPVG